MKKISPARNCALNALSYIRIHNAYARDVLNSDPHIQKLDPADKAFCSKLVLGVTSTVGVLDEEIDTHVKRPNKLAPALRDVLRLSTYELLFLQKEPHAAVSQGVELTKKVAPKAAGLSNAVLRKISQRANDFPYGDPQEDIEALARLYGFPVPFATYLIDKLGRTRATKLMQAQQSPAPLFITTIPTVTPDDQVGKLLEMHHIMASQVEPIPGAWLILDAPQFMQSGLIERHGLIPMDYSAQTVAALVAGTGDHTILEVGSGRGTKSAVIASHAIRNGNTPRIVALDLHAYKSELASKRLDALNIPGVTQHTADASDVKALDALDEYETVFLDAPCSGSGTLRRNPELVWDTTADKVKSLSTLQINMLKALSTHVSAGGELIYATCSVICQENQEVVDAFLRTEAGRNFKLAPVYERAGLSADQAEQLKDRCTERGCLQTFPAEGGADGHFCARLVRVK